MIHATLQFLGLAITLTAVGARAASQISAIRRGRRGSARPSREQRVVQQAR